MSSSTPGARPYYFVPPPSRHPAMAAIGLLGIIFGAAMWINGGDAFKYLMFAGFLWLFGVLFQWFRDAVRESEGGMYGHKIDLSFRWSMSWFIFSEVMFFGAFFTALWWMRAHSVPELGGVAHGLLWPDFKATWPSVTPGATASPRASSNPSRPWAPSGCPPSTRRCCCPRA